MENQNKFILLFDGDCSFCNFWVKFIGKKDAKKQFDFYPLNSEKGINLKQKYKIDPSIDSIVLIKKNKSYIKSSAALQVVKSLNFPWKILYIFTLVPKFIRDKTYDLIAKNRHRFFKDTCELPS